MGSYVLKLEHIVASAYGIGIHNGLYSVHGEGCVYVLVASVVYKRLCYRKVDGQIMLQRKGCAGEMHINGYESDAVCIRISLCG